MQVKSCLPARKATGPDGISTVMLKQCAVVISPFTVFGGSSSCLENLQGSLFTSAAQKSKDTSLVKNFRPISLLSLVGNI